jgi:peptide/nickel transport system substrate-binding protein
MHSRRAVVWLSALLVVAGCAAPATQTSGGPVDQAGRPGGAKVLTWAIVETPTDVQALSGVGGTRAHVSAIRPIAHARLVVDDFSLAPHPQLAVELPSTERGTWRVNADGTMETTWRLRPNVKWHDGTPFTSADLVFWFSVLKDPFLPSVNLIGLDQVATTSAPDPLTFTVHWSEIYYRADRFPDTGPIPRHLLDKLYEQKDAEAFLGSRYFTSEFIGLGPYRMTRWDPGSEIEFARFDGYFEGPPALDRVIVRTISDFNTMASNVLAEAVDLATAPGEQMDVASDLKRRWEGNGNRVRTDANDRVRVVYLQVRPDYARPRNALINPAVRQALFFASDRPALAQVVTDALSPVADSWLAPTNPLRKELEASIPQYPHDPSRAGPLMAQAGWVRGSDGILVNPESGDRLELDLRTRPGSGSQRELFVLADQWSAIGVAPIVTTTPPTLVGDREYLATYPGIQTSRLESEDASNGRRLHTRNIAAPGNRWSGRNGAGYSNPRADALSDRLVATIDRTEQIRLQRELLQEMLGDVAFIPMFWDIELALVTKRVKGDVSAVETGWNISTWDRE